MGLRKLKCDSCGANLEVDDQLTVGFCQYCGAKFLLEEKVNVSVTVKVDNQNESKINTANLYMQEGNYEKAEKIFKNVLADDINNHQAWWGRYICETYYASYYGYTNRYGETSPLIKANIINKNLQYAYKAIENSSDETAEAYKLAIAPDEEYVASILK